MGLNIYPELGINKYISLRIDRGKHWKEIMEYEIEYNGKIHALRWKLYKG